MQASLHHLDDGFRDFAAHTFGSFVILASLQLLVYVRALWKTFGAVRCLLLRLIEFLGGGPVCVTSARLLATLGWRWLRLHLARKVFCGVRSRIRECICVYVFSHMYITLLCNSDCSSSQHCSLQRLGMRKGFKVLRGASEGSNFPQRLPCDA